MSLSNPSADLRGALQPLAIAVIGGLSTATAFTLVVIPVLYAGIVRQVAS